MIRYNIIAGKIGFSSGVALKVADDSFKKVNTCAFSDLRYKSYWRKGEGGRKTFRKRSFSRENENSFKTS